MRAARLAQTPTGSNVPLLAVGPGLVLYHLVSGNLGLATVGMGDRQLAFPVAALIVAVGLAAGLAVQHAGGPWSAALTLLAGLALLYVGISGEPVAYAAVAGLNVIVLRSVLRAGAATPSAHARRAALWLTLGMLLQAGLLFAYYSTTGSSTLMAAALVLLVAGRLASRDGHGQQRHFDRTAITPVALVAALLALACAWQFATWDTPHAQARQLGDQFTVMTYNLQSGFARDNFWSLEAQARVIEAQQPDILILQEVSRGWLVTTGNDELLWLSQRLKMPYVWGPASDDGLWGNAILSRVALSEQDATKFASTANLKRGAVRTQVQTPAGVLWIYGTHLDNPSGAGAVRREQVDELLRFISNNQPAILGGDFNATPDSDVLAALHAAGFSDYAALLDPGVTTSEDGKRIDYLLLKGRLTVEATLVPEVWASDHKPFVLRVRVGE
jgi:endonuclease/exonuclease/phosphatase family metal-dependent hydrolase